MSLEFDENLKGCRLAFRKDGARDELGPCGFFWLGGFKSDMDGSKAEALANLATSTRRNALRFDYSGHGLSSGDFIDGTISQWLEQATHMFLSHTKNKRIIVGSSMGGWLALLLAQKLLLEDPAAFRRIGGVVLIAPATDMTHDLMWEEFSEHQRDELLQNGILLKPSDYGAPYEITRLLIEDGYLHMLLPKKLQLPFPVRIIHGTNDDAVPVKHALKTMESLRAQDITLELIKNGDHRLSSATQLDVIKQATLKLAERADGIRV